MLVLRLFLVLNIVLVSFQVYSFQFSGLGSRRCASLLLRLKSTPRGVGTGYFKAREGRSVSNVRSLNITAVDQANTFTSDYVHVGNIIGAHGVHGEVKMQLSDDFTTLKVQAGLDMYLRKPNRQSPYPVRIVKSRRHGSSTSEIHLVLFDEVRTRTAADLLRKYEVYIKDSNVRASLQSNEYMVRDIVDLDCYHIRDYDAVMVQLEAIAESSARPENATDRILPIARVEGVVTPDELCEGPIAASLMHSQLELQVFPADKRRRKAQEHGAIKIPSSITNLSPVKLKQTKMCCLLPLVPSIVPVVDIARRVIFLDPPDGLLSLTYEVK